MTLTLLWIVPALALLACGWFASAWYYRRKLDALQRKLKAVRNTAAEHADQARKQIGQLQFEIAERAASVRGVREARPAPAVAKDAPALEIPLLPEDGFAETTIGPTGFLPTQVMEDKHRKPG